jgi:glyoxylase-like metal-dependent hydrolase (beta-lactamase superfamily II)
VLTGGVWKHGFEVTSVPGHTEGSSILHHGPSETLFSGDTILAGPPPLRSIESLRLAVRGFSVDVESAHRNVKRFLEKLPPTRTLCSGHGPAVKRAAREKLLALLER